MLFIRGSYVVFYSIFVCSFAWGFIPQSKTSITHLRPLSSLNPAHDVGILNENMCNIATTAVSQTSEAHTLFTKSVDIASTKHQFSDAIKSASYQLFLESERMEGVEHKLELMNNDLHHKANDIGHEIGYMMVKLISSILPHVDTIGHKVLHMDDEIINYFLNLDSLSPELKKQIILGIIHISQQGDHMGAQMLQLYYDIVSKLM